MVSRLQIFLRFAGVGAGWGAAAGAEADLVAKSPFMSAAAPGAAAPTAGAPLEFRGTMQTAAGLKARIVDPSRKAGTWLLINERDPSFDFVVKQIDTEHETVTVEYQGRPLTLAQHVAKVASSGAAQTMANVPPNVGPPMPAAITNSVVVNPTPADEQRRLDAVAAEVARRRALREQASQQVNQGVPLAPQVIQQQQDFRAQQQQQNAAQQNNAAQRAQRNNQQRPRSNQP
jgi:hypothetical protein